MLTAIEQGTDMHRSIERGIPFHVLQHGLRYTYAPSANGQFYLINVSTDPG